MSKFSQSTIARLGYLVLKTPEHNLVTSLNWAGSQHFSRLRPFCPGSIMDQFDVTASIDWLLAIIPCALSPWCPGLHYSAHSGPWPLTEVSGVSSQSRPVPSLRPGQVSQQNTTGSKMPALASTHEYSGGTGSWYQLGQAGRVMGGSQTVRVALICSNLNDLLLFNCLITHRTIKSIIGLIVGQMKLIEAVTVGRGSPQVSSLHLSPSWRSSFPGVWALIILLEIDLRQSQHSDAVVGVTRGRGNYTRGWWSKPQNIHEEEKSTGGNIISHQILISYCGFEYKSSLWKVHSNLPRKILSFEIVSFVLWAKRKKMKIGHSLKNLIKILTWLDNLCWKPALAETESTDFPLRSIQVILLNLKSSLRFELMKHSHSEY